MSDTCPRCGARFPEGRLAACPVCLLGEDEGEPESLAGRYELLAELGGGGMARVYAARDRRSGERVAVKLLPLESSDRPGMMERFRREARTLARLRHPHIVALRGFGRDGAHAYIAMELVDGRPLSAEVPAGPARVVEIVAQICDALRYAHAQGVVHRDLKPVNVLVDRQGRVKIADFGIAGLVPGASDDTRVTLDNVTVGTPAYMAPEARAGAAPDPRMDVYSLGVLVFELLTGRVPAFSGDLPGGEFDDLLARALTPDPARRYATVDALRRDLPAAAGPAGIRKLPLAEAAFQWGVALALAVGTLLLLEAAGGLLRGAPARALAAPIVWGNLAAAVGLVVHARLARRWELLGYGPPPPPRVAFEAAASRDELPPARLPFPPLGVVLAALVAAAAQLVAGGALDTLGDRPWTALSRLGETAAALALAGFWADVLEARRLARSLRGERLLFAGLSLLLARGWLPYAL